MKYVFFVNQQARDGKLRSLWREAEPRIVSQLRRFEICFPQSAQETRDMAKAYADEGGAVLVAVGGEGTMNMVMQGIMDSEGRDETVMALVPLGNVNDYAATLGMEKNWRHAVQTLIEGEERRVGLTELITPTSRSLALNIADIGFGASTAKLHSVEHRLSWVKGRLKYNLLALRTLLGWRNMPARILIDDEEIEGDLVMALAGFSPTLGGFHLLPHADPYDDRFAVTLGINASRRDILRLLGDAKHGRMIPDDQLIFRKASRLVVEPQGGLVTQVDGEITDTRARHIEFRSHPGKLRFMAPRDR
jgi:diacylglycerol kinase (ATP)